MSLTYNEVNLLRNETLPRVYTFEFIFECNLGSMNTKICYLVQFDENLNLDVMLPSNVNISVLELVVEGEKFELDLHSTGDIKLAKLVTSLLHYDRPLLAEFERQLWLHYQAESDAGNMQRSSALTWLL